MLNVLPERLNWVKNNSCSIDFLQITPKAREKGTWIPDIQSIPEISSFDFLSPLVKQFKFNFVPWVKSFHLLSGLCPSLSCCSSCADAMGNIHLTYKYDMWGISCEKCLCNHYTKWLCWITAKWCKIFWMSQLVHSLSSTHLWKV